MIPFNRPLILGTEKAFIAEAIAEGKFSGDGRFTRQCSQWIEANINVSKSLLTTSCTHALELAALLCDIRPGDEVIAPSFTFVSTANAFALRGAKIVFVDIRPDTMNIDETKIEAAITPRTKAIAVMHYAGVACQMDEIMRIADRYNIFVVEDAAQCLGATYKGRFLGGIGRLGAFSFHETKNIHCGEGGALLINDAKYNDRAAIIREKGTNRMAFLKGEVNKYSWVDLGSSYLPNELTTAFLFAQLSAADLVKNKRLQLWQTYYEMLSGVLDDITLDTAIGSFTLPTIPPECAHNGHIFYIKCKNSEVRSKLIAFLKYRGIQSAFHYIPLHTAQAGVLFGRFHGADVYTTMESEKLLRLPLYYDLSEKDVRYVAETIQDFYRR